LRDPKKMTKSSELYEEKKQNLTLVSYCQGMPLGHVDEKKLKQTFLMPVHTVPLGEKMEFTAQKGKGKGHEEI
jgi:hypothetical protein